MRLLAALLLVLLTPTALAQDAQRLDLATHTVSLEVGGNAAPVSLNLDARLAGGYVLRFGGMLYPLWETYESADAFEDDAYVPATPSFGTGTLTVSRLYGRGRARIEVGGGVLGRFNNTDNPGYFPSTVGLTGVFGLRVQPERGDFGVRLAFTPLVDRRGLHAIGGFALLYGFS